MPGRITMSTAHALLYLCCMAMMALSATCQQNPSTTPTTTCSFQLQGVTPGVEQRSSFFLHNADLVCSDNQLEVVGHPALDPFADKFQGVRYRRRPNQTPTRGALLQFVGPGVALLRNSTATFLRVNQSIALVHVTNGLRATLRNTAITQNRGGFQTPLMVTDGATLHIENSVIVNNTVAAAGAVWVRNGSVLTSSNQTVLSGNGNVTSGTIPQVGAVLIMDNSRANLTNTSIAGNAGSVAGAILGTNNSTLQLQQVEFSGNTLRRGPPARDDTSPLTNTLLSQHQGPLRVGGIVLINASSAILRNTNIFKSEVKDEGLVKVAASALFVGPGCSARLNEMRLELNDGLEHPTVGVSSNGGELQGGGIEFDANVPFDVGCVGVNATEPLDTVGGGQLEVVNCVGGFRAAGRVFGGDKPVPPPGLYPSSGAAPAAAGASADTCCATDGAAVGGGADKGTAKQRKTTAAGSKS